MLDDYALKIVPLHLEQCSLVIATSARIKGELLAIAPDVNPDRILVKPNAIDTTRFPFVARSEPASGQPFRLVCVSRIEPKKGILYLVEAVRHLIDRKIAISVHVLGGVDDNEISRNYATAVEARVRELCVGHAIHFEGRRSGQEIRTFLQQSHLFVAPFVETENGDKDGIPTALLEAMATGLPGVATDAGSIAEVIDSGDDGIIVPQRDSKALSESIIVLLADPSRRAEMAAKAAKKIRRCFDIRECEQAFHQRIRVVAGGSQHGRGR
jgi:glycosyltransferase involved in cell wall biosynthesis